MIARLQQFTTLALVLAAAAWAAHFLSRGQPGWAAWGALVILAGYAAFLAVEFTLAAAVNRQDPAPGAKLGQWVAAWFGEVCTAPRVFGLRQPFRSRAEPDSLQVQAAGARGVVLVHGFVCNRGLWNPWLARLRQAGVPFVAVNLEPAFGSIDEYVSVIEHAVQRVQAATGTSPVLVAHSMGGLAVRAWLASAASDANDARVHRVITIGSPHRGTWLARFGHTVNGRQMRVDGSWLTALAAREPAQRFARFTCFYSHCDNIVFPASTATLPGAVNVHVPATAHVQLAFQGAAFVELMAWCLEGSAPPPAERR
jgi:triacylglycerol lipase